MYNPIFASVNILIILLALWTIPWKIYAVWTAAKRDEKKWFVVLLILNTASILELIYIFRIAKKSWAEVKMDFRKAWDSITTKKVS